MHLFADPEFWVLVAAAIFVAVVWKPAKKSLIGSLDERAARIRAELDEAKKLHDEAEQLLAQYQQKGRERRPKPRPSSRMPAKRPNASPRNRPATSLTHWRGASASPRSGSPRPSRRRSTKSAPSRSMLRWRGARGHRVADRRGAGRGIA